MAIVRLVGLTGTYAGTEFTLAPGDNLVGRAPEMAVCLVRDETVSRRHAVILVGSGSVAIRDLESRNGILVAGQRVRSTPLSPGARIQIGSTVFEIGAVSRPLETMPPIERMPIGLESAIAGMGDLSDPRWLASLGYIGNLIGIPLFFFALNAAAKMKAAYPHSSVASGVTTPIDPRLQVARYLEFHGRQARWLFVVEFCVALVIALPSIALVIIPQVFGAGGLGFVVASLVIGVILALGLFFAWMNGAALVHARAGAMWMAPLYERLGKGA